MAVIFKIFGALLFHTLLLSSAFAQYKLLNAPSRLQIKKGPYNHPQPQLVKSLLSTYSSNIPFAEKLNTIAAVIQKLPPINPGISQKRIYMAEALKKTALESLMFAANACKCSPMAEVRIPLPQRPMTVGNDVLANRAVNIRYDRYP